ncbi:MAG: hypothetical protein P8M78_05095 [Myxococcota bacterium]|nr:hypothetical protein [Myxococcota bacterium]
MTASRIRWACLAAIYAIFLFWYGGSREPVSPEKIEEYVALFESRGAQERSEAQGPGPRSADAAENLRSFLESDDGQEFVMLNLNVHRDSPEYGAGREGHHAIASAEEAEKEYQRQVAPLLLMRASHPLVMVEPAFLIGGIGDFERQDWDLASMVRYRSRQDFVEFILTPEFSQNVDHKWAALSRSTAMATVPVISFATMRLVPLLILIIIGLLLDRMNAAHDKAFLKRFSKRETFHV